MSWCALASSATTWGIGYALVAFDSRRFRPFALLGAISKTIFAAVYATAKAAVHCLTKGMAKELAPHGIRVNGVAPGVIDTPFHERMSTPEMMKQFAASVPLGRAGTSEECGRVIAFLASDAAAYIHGELIEINGGQLMV